MNPAVEFTVGQMRCWSVCAGRGRFRAQAFFANAPDDALAQALDRHHLPHDILDTPFNCLLVNWQGRLLLVDTGIRGEQLARRLGQAGFDAGQIDTVILSHAHLDHIGGAITSEGSPTFPNARYLISGEDWRQASRSKNKARDVLSALGGQLDLIDPPCEALPGVRLLAAPGHTPGQVIVEFVCGGETLIYTSDTLAHPIHVEHPEWHIVSDADPAQAFATRQSVMARALAPNCRLFVYHFPAPALYQLQLRDGVYTATALPPASGQT